VERDYQGNPTEAHAPEAPTRFTKQLLQVMRGGVAVGMDRKDALRLAMRIARDSIPPLRHRIIEIMYYSKTPLTAWQMSGLLNEPRTTIGREMDALQLLRVLTVDRREDDEDLPPGRRSWKFALDRSVDWQTVGDDLLGGA
jgi:hypothetical protein